MPLTSKQCRVGSETERPCPRLAVAELRGVAFCERCAREQAAYFAIGELTKEGEEQTRSLRDEPLLVEALGRMRREMIMESYNVKTERS